MTSTFSSKFLFLTQKHKDLEVFFYGSKKLGKLEWRGSAASTFISGIA
jgi:hypothetical protein